MNRNLLLMERPQVGCVCLTLNRPSSLNALSGELRQSLVHALDSLALDDSVRAVVLTGAGRAFCAGLDLKELGQVGLPILGASDDPIAALARFPHPVIAAINGDAVTGGFELALACDVLLASSVARFADTHARIGVIPGWGLSQKLGRLIGPSRAKELAFTGNFVDARTADQWGLVNRVVEPEALLPAALALAADMAGTLPNLVRAYKRLMDDGQYLPLGEALEMEKHRSLEWAQTQKPEALAKRQAAMQRRGRLQP